MRVLSVDLGTFTLDGKSVFGTIFTPLPSTGSQPDRKDPATYFEENVKPGT